MMKQFEVLKWASSFLKKYNREEKVAEILLQHHLHLSREAFFLNMRENIDETIIDRFKKDIEQHSLTGIPYQHLTGYECFYGRKFVVNEHVLIPRQETEELVQLVIEHYKQQEDPVTIVDIGTGSGIIAVTLALELQHVKVYATDISEKALNVAKQNAKRLEANIQFLHGDFLKPIIDHNIYPHVIVSNPPYIKMSDKKLLQDSVKQFDPHIALFAKDNGLHSYENILKQSTNIMTQLESIYFEIGFDQGKDVSKLISTIYPQSINKVIKDINDNDRIIHIKM